jgi:hypothetical protein
MAETFARTAVQLATTAATDVIAAPNTNAADRAVVMSVLVANVTTSLASFTVQLTNNANTVLSTLAHQLDIPGKTSIEVIVNKQVLMAGDKIRVTAGAANVINVTASALEITA